MNSNDITTLNEKLNRIKDATDSIRDTLGMSTEDVIETVASGVSTLQGEKEQLEHDLEHAEERVLNEYFNINLNNTTNWTEMQKEPVPYEANGLSNLAHYFENYPFSSLNINGTFGMPTSLNGTFSGCMATDIDIPEINTSHVVDFSDCFQGYYGQGSAINTSIIQDIIQDWDTSSGQNFTAMFGWTYNITGDLDVSHFDMSNATSIENMFACSGMYVHGIENWDVSNVDYFAYCFGDKNSSPMWDLDLTNWYNNKVSDNQMRVYMFAGYGYNGPQRLLIPNIKDDYRSMDTETANLLYNDYHLTFADISGLGRWNGYNGTLDGVSNWCTVVVKNDTIRQGLLECYPDMKQIYTKAEYEANNDLYTTFNLYITDKEGNDIADSKGRKGQFRIEYQDENETWVNCWENNSAWLRYLYEGYPIILPRGRDYRFYANYLETESETYEVNANQAQIDIEMEAGPTIYTVDFTVYDNDGDLIPQSEQYTIRYSIQWQEWRNMNVTGSQFSIQVPEGYNLQLQYGSTSDRILIDSYSNYIYDNTDINLRCNWNSPSIHVASYQWANGEIADTENKTLGYAWYNDEGEIVQGDSTTTLYPVTSGVGRNIKTITTNQNSLRVFVTYNNVTYYEQLYQYDEIPMTIEIPTVILPTPITGIARVSIKDASTGALVDPSIIQTVYLVNSQDEGGKIYSYNNPIEIKTKVGNYYACAVPMQNSNYYDNFSVNFDVIEDEVTDITVYLPYAFQTVITYLDQSGNNVDHGNCVSVVGVFYNNGTEVCRIGMGEFWPCGDDPAYLAKYNYNNLSTWDQFKLIFNDDNEMWQYESNLINYVEGQYVYNVTVQQTPIPNYTMTINLKDENTSQNYNGPYSLEYNGHERGGSGNISGTGSTISFTDIADDYDMNITNLDGYEDWNDTGGLYNNTTITAYLTPTEPMGTVHAIMHFDKEPTAIQFSDGESVNYEYEPTGPLTFELDVPAMQELYIYAECEGDYANVDTSMWVDDSDIEEWFDFNCHYTITVYDENGELIPDGDENLEIYDDYWEETDHSNPFVIWDITPGSIFNITVSYPGYVTQTNSVTVDDNDSWDVYLEPEEPPEYAEITIQVVDENGNNIQNHIEYEISNETDGHTSWYESEENPCSINNLFIIGKTYQLYLSSDGYQITATDSFTVTGDASYQFTMHSVPSYTVSVKDGQTGEDIIPSELNYIVYVYNQAGGCLEMTSDTAYSTNTINFSIGATNGVYYRLHIKEIEGYHECVIKRNLNDGFAFTAFLEPKELAPGDYKNIGISVVDANNQRVNNDSLLYRFINLTLDTREEYICDPYVPNMRYFSQSFRAGDNYIIEIYADSFELLKYPYTVTDDDTITLTLQQPAQNSQITITYEDENGNPVKAKTSEHPEYPLLTSTCRYYNAVDSQRYFAGWDSDNCGLIHQGDLLHDTYRLHISVQCEGYENFEEDYYPEGENMNITVQLTSVEEE